METKKQTQDHRPSWGSVSNAHQAPRATGQVLPDPGLALASGYWVSVAPVKRQDEGITSGLILPGVRLWREALGVTGVEFRMWETLPRVWAGKHRGSGNRFDTVSHL